MEYPMEINIVLSVIRYYTTKHYMKGNYSELNLKHVLSNMHTQM